MKKTDLFDKNPYSWATTYRPNTIDEMALAPAYREEFLMIEDMGYLPNSIILHGPPGCGKTTIAKILGNLPDYASVEIDCGEDNSKGHFQNLVRNITSRVVSGEKKRLVFLDEYNRMNENAQQVLNKTMEDTADLNTFIIATNYYNHLTPQLQNRCSVYRMNFCEYDESKNTLEMYSADHGMTKQDWIKELRRAARLVAKKNKIKVPVHIFENVEKRIDTLVSVRGYMRAVGNACMKEDYKNKKIR